MDFAAFVEIPNTFAKSRGSGHAPAGWLECDGSILSINLYTELYNVVGQNFKTSTTFNTLTGFQIPDLRGQFVRGWDHGANVDSGRVFGKAQDDMLESHTHFVPLAQGIAGSGSNGAFMGGQFNPGGTTSNATGGTETRPKNVALLYCIKT